MHGKKLLILGTAIATTTLLALAGFVNAEQEKILCPDMGEHQSVLDEGERYYREHGGGSGGSGGYGVDDAENLLHPHERVHPLMNAPRDVTEVRSDSEPRISKVHALPEDKIDSLPLVKNSDFSSAQFCARVYEENGRFEAAERLYERIVNARKITLHPNQEDIALAEQDLARAKLFESARKNVLEGEFAQARRELSEILDQIDTSQTLDPRCKAQLIENVRMNLAWWRIAELEPQLTKLLRSFDDDLYERQHEKALRDFNQLKDAIDKSRNLDSTYKVQLLDQVRLCLRFGFYNYKTDIIAGQETLLAKPVISAKVSGVPATAPNELAGLDELKQRTQRLHHNYVRALQCLNMAEDLNSTAHKLAASQSYDMARKLYTEALEIKQKNLGNDDPDTLSEYSELAQLSVSQGRYAEAADIFEKALSSFRKLPNPGREYGTMLETYAQMLANHHENAKADKIYAEARKFYKQPSNSTD